MRNKEILDSWKAISAYLDRDIRTCARWEKELALPIHRFDEDSPRSKVFAYKSEIDEWLKEKKIHKDIKKKPFLEKRWAIIGLVTVVTLVMAVSASIYIANGRLSPAYPENLAIAVLPSESLNFSSHEQYIPEGICNEIIHSLSRIGNLRTIPVDSLAISENPKKYLDNIKEKFKVNHLLKTKIKKNHDKLKVCAQLIRTEDEKVIWNLGSQARLEDIFSLKEDICLKICKKLNPNNKIMPVNALNNANTRNNGAFNSYLKGNHILKRANSENDDPWKLYIQGTYYQGKWTKESNDWAINFFSKAVELDDNFAKAYIGLARCYLNYINFNWDYNKKWLNKAEELLKKASSIDPECSEYYSTLIQVYLIKHFIFEENTKEKAFELAQQAIEKYPGCPFLCSLLGFCYYLRFGESGNELDFNKSLELNEQSYYLRPYHINNIRYAELLMLNREYERALAACSEIQGGEAALMADFLMGEIYYFMGDLHNSYSIFLKLSTVNDINSQIASLFYLGMIAAQEGNASEAERILKKIKVIVPNGLDYYDEEPKMASIYMGIGKEELGYDSLEDFFSKDKTDNTRYLFLKYIEIDRNFDNCRNEERFKNIIQ
jgi:TolB-like protein